MKDFQDEMLEIARLRCLSDELLDKKRCRENDKGMKRFHNLLGELKAEGHPGEDIVKILLELMKYDEEKVKIISGCASLILKVNQLEAQLVQSQLGRRIG